MTQSFLQWVLKVLPDSSSFYSYYGRNSNVESLKNWFEEKNKKIIKNSGTELSFKAFDFECYNEYFKLLKSSGLQSDFEVKSSKDGITLRGSFIKSFFVNSVNKNKIIIFCHGVSNNRWSLFYSSYIALQLGYDIVIYDARNHGLSEKSYTTLGSVESEDLEDIVKWSLEKTGSRSIGIYGFSMGASTVIHWVGKFQNVHSEVKALFCEAPFDDFAKRFNFFLSNKKNIESFDEFSSDSKDQESNKIENSYLFKAKNYFFYNLAMKIFKSPLDLYNIKPILSLPETIKPKILIIHGLEDSVINFNSSVEIWKKISENELNKGKVELFLVNDADHGDIFFFGDFLKKKIYSHDNPEKNKDLTFSSIFYSFFQENL